MNISINEAQRIAKGLRQSGKSREAQAVYRQILAKDNSDIEALMSLGVTYIELGEPTSAISFLHRAHVISPDDVTVCTHYGRALELSGKHNQTIELLIKSIQNHEDKFQEPLPEVATLHTHLAEILHEKGRLDDASVHCRKALKVDANHAPAYQILGNIQTRFQLWPSAIEQYRKCIELQPENAIVRNNLGILFRQVGELEQSAHSLEAALLCDPGNIEYLTGLGITLIVSKNTTKANEIFSRAVKLHPKNFEANLYLGKTFELQKNYPAALTSYANAAKIKPDDPQPFLQISITLRKMGRYQEALNSTEQVLQDQKGASPLQQMAAELQLAQGLWSKGWASLHNYYSHPSTWNKELKLAMPLWQGESLEKNSVLLHNSADYSDEIFFSRFIRPLAEQGAKVIVHTDPRMEKLLLNVQGVHQVVTDDKNLPACDWHTPVQRLPALLKVDQPEFSGFSEGEVLQGTPLKVGIAWEGISPFNGCETQSLPLQGFSKLGEKESLNLFALQWGLKHNLKQENLNSEIVDLEEDCIGFHQIAQVIKDMDIIISCDCAIAHLAAFLGKKVWLVTPPQTSWYWVHEKLAQGLYPSARIFRQSKESDWSEVFDKIKSELLLLR